MLEKRNYRILVVDDIPSIHQDFRKILAPESDESYTHLDEMKTLVGSPAKAKAGLPPFELEFALQAKEGVEHVKTACQNGHPFAVAFVDVQMPPGDDGIKAIEEMWAIDQEIQTVICTAYANYTWEELQQRLGDTDRLFVLKKPFDNLEIIQLACSLCKKWNLSKLRHTPLSQSSMKTMASSDATMERLNDAMNILSRLNDKLKQ